MKHFTLSLRDIASWSDEKIPPLNPENGRASIPALQRGLVWSPRQIELLWDSLMRGIPVGSFVLCRHIEQQAKVRGENAQYHLLDGQQRANAIYLGFAPFPPRSDADSILWIDLDPGTIHNSTRSYLVRVTTSSHPWGYVRDDNAGRLGVARIRAGLSEYQFYPGQEDYKRPLPKQLQPTEANCPVPLSLVLSAYKESTEEFRQAIKDAIGSTAKHETALPWMKKCLAKLEDPSFSLNKIHSGVKISLNATIIALMAPEDFSAESDQEIATNENEANSNITNLEHLFQRLNQQGTTLNGEELSYSLIKAYWPELVTKVDSIAGKIMPASRLVSLAVRVVMSEKQGKLVGTQTVSQIRKIAQDVKNDQLKQHILNFIMGDGCDGLEACCHRIDHWLGVGNEWGLLPVLRTGIAHRNQDLYLLLLILARKYTDDISEELSRMITGVTTLCAWFGNGREWELASCLLKNLQTELTEQSVIIAVSLSKPHLQTLHSPANVDNFVKLPQIDDRFGGWRWWNLIASEDKQEQGQRAKEWWNLVSTIKERRELLLFAQRGFLRKKYPDYDPARKDLWESQNRPWDFDHILPSAYTYNIKKNNDYLPLCKEWCNTLGNLRAWPLESNRSDRATIARNKLDDGKFIDSFIGASGFVWGLFIG